MQQPVQDESRMTFEDSVEKLESIIQRLQDGNLPLQEMLRLYSEGTVLHQQCLSLIQQAQLQIQQISMNAEESQPILVQVQETLFQA